MKIGKQLQLLSAMSVVLASVLLLSLAWAWVQIDRTQQRADYIDAVLPLVLDLEIRLRSYSLGGTGQAGQGWRTAHTALLKVLEKPPRLPGEQQILLNSVISNSKGLGVLFGHLRTLGGSATDTGRRGETKRHITERLLVQMETIREDAIRLATLSRDNLSATLVTQLIGVAVIIVVVAVTFTVTSLRLTCRLRAAIPELQAAVAAVSSGDLDTVINEPKVDELADIARRFNHMTRELRDTMISRDRLQAIVQERTAALQVLANSDPLTGIANRRLLFERGAQEFARARRHGGGLGVVMIDCDRFKQVNDRYGHDVGDLCLQHVAELCAREIRDEDLVARYGGEEFALLLPDSDLDGSYRLAERIRCRIRETPLQAASGEITLTVSVGVAALGEGSEDFEQLLVRADRALLVAKAAGRDRTERAGGA